MYLSCFNLSTPTLRRNQDVIMCFVVIFLCRLIALFLFISSAGLVVLFSRILSVYQVCEGKFYFPLSFKEKYSVKHLSWTTFFRNYLVSVIFIQCFISPHRKCIHVTKILLHFFYLFLCHSYQIILSFVLY